GDEQLGVLAGDGPDPRRDPRRVEDAHLDAALAQVGKELPRLAAPAYPVREHAHMNAASCGACQRVEETLTDFVGAKDVALDRDRPSGVMNELEHLIEGLGPVVQ